MAEAGADRRRARVFLWLGAAALGVIALALAWELRGPLVLALVLGFLVQPLHRRLAPRVRWPWLSGIILTLLVIVLIVLPFAMLALALVADVQRVADAAMKPGGPERLADGALEALGLPPDTADALVAQAGGALRTFGEGMILPALSAGIGFVLALVIFLILLYFLIVDWGRLAGFAKRVVPLDEQERDLLFKHAGQRVKALVLGSLVVAVVQAIVAGLGWWVLGLPSPIFWAFVMLVLEFVPLLGSFVVLLPATIWAFATGQWGVGVGLLVLNFIAVGLIDDLLRAWIVGRWSGIHPALVLIGLAGGIPVFGLTGIILGPLFVSLLPLFLEAVAGAGPTRLQEATTSDAHEE